MDIFYPGNPLTKVEGTKETKAADNVQGSKKQTTETKKDESAV